MAPTSPILRWAARPTALRIPHADKRRVAPPGDACGIVVAPMALVASCGRGIPAYQGAQVAAVWVGTSRPASWACRGATAAGNAMAKHGARVARRRDCAAFGCGVHRAPAACVQRLRPLLAGRQIGRGAAVVRSGHGGEGLPSRGSGGATPCRGAALGGGRDAGISGFRAQRLTKRFRWLAIET